MIVPKSPAGRVDSRTVKQATATSAGSDTAAPAKRRGFGDAPLSHKVSLLIGAAAVWGTVVGLVAVHLSTPVWYAFLGVLVVTWLLLFSARLTVWQPIERLVDQTTRMTRPADPLPARDLPLGRHDEVGALARAIQRLNDAAARTSIEARQLRRTLDDRVEKATRQATQQLSEMAYRDSMTQLANRRFLDTHLEPLVKSCRDSRTDLVGIVIDVDHFKQVNDTLGHQAGDELIIFVSELIRGLVRSGDYAVRLGGDEFVILLPGVTPRRGTMLSEQLRDLFASQVRTLMPDQPDLGLSIGIASLQMDNARTGRQLLEAADNRLYKAKRQGKGRVVSG
jgi:diguanylate cyclase (GGDEF)-like protein